MNMPNFLSKLFSSEHIPKKKDYMVIRVDIDNTICKTPGTDYKNAVPNHNRIDRINNLYKSGHKIIYWTSRKSSSSIRELTERQLEEWGCMYHALEMSKPEFDLFIDDNALNANDYFYGV